MDFFNSLEIIKKEKDVSKSVVISMEGDLPGNREKEEINKYIHEKHRDYLGKRIMGIFDETCKFTHITFTIHLYLLCRKRKTEITPKEKTQDPFVFFCHGTNYQRPSGFK